MNRPLKLFFLAAATLLAVTVVLLAVTNVVGRENQGAGTTLVMLVLGFLSVGIPVVGGYGIILGIVTLVGRWRKRRAGEAQGEIEPETVEAAATSARRRY